MRRTTCLTATAWALTATLVGCQHGPRMGGLNPFFREDRTTFMVPAKRIAAIRQTAAESTGEDTPAQQALVRELVAQLATENDPLARQAILETAAEFNTPLANKALLAGLSDTDASVREATCGLLENRPAPGVAEALASVVQGDDSFDVRIAAARAMGSSGARKEQLLPILEDPDPAMQLVGVEAMREITGEDYGGDVSTYRALARGEDPPTPPEERRSVAGRLSDWAPFF